VNGEGKEHGENLEDQVDPEMSAANRAGRGEVCLAEKGGASPEGPENPHYRKSEENLVPAAVEEEASARALAHPTG